MIFLRSRRSRDVRICYRASSVNLNSNFSLLKKAHLKRNFDPLKKFIMRVREHDARTLLQSQLFYYSRKAKYQKKSPQVKFVLTMHSSTSLSGRWGLLLFELKRVQQSLTLSDYACAFQNRLYLLKKVHLKRNFDPLKKVHSEEHSHDARILLQSKLLYYSIEAKY